MDIPVVSALLNQFQHTWKYESLESVEQFLAGRVTFDEVETRKEMARRRKEMAAQARSLNRERAMAGRGYCPQPGWEDAEFGDTFF